jgi:hypothetical protein
VAVGDDIARVEGKIDELSAGMSTMRTCVTTLATRLENYPEVSKQVADHENRLTALEDLEVRKYSERLQKLEGSVSSFKGWIAGATAVAATAGGLVTWFLAQALAP